MKMLSKEQDILINRRIQKEITTFLSMQDVTLKNLGGKLDIPFSTVQRDLNNITSITMHVISALIINSKIRPDEKVPDIFDLLTSLSQTYIEYFSNKLMFKYGKDYKGTDVPKRE